MDDYYLILEAGKKKYQFFSVAPGKFFAKSVLAGVYLGVAMILSLALGSLAGTIHPALSKVAFAMFFGLTFVLIVFLNGELFTGNCLTTVFPVISRGESFVALGKLWATSLLGNALGVIGFSILFIHSYALDSFVHPYLASLVSAKMDVTLSHLFIKSILCNFIVCIATYTALKVKDELAKTVIMLLTIMTFVLYGFDHCIANIGLYMMQWIVNARILESGLVIQSVAISIVGNVIGGAVLLALPIYYISSPVNKNTPAR